MASSLLSLVPLVLSLFVFLRLGSLLKAMRAERLESIRVMFASYPSVVSAVSYMVGVPSLFSAPGLNFGERRSD